LRSGYLNLEGDKYPIITLTDRSYAVLKGHEQIHVRMEIKKEKIHAVQEEYDEVLFEALRLLRKEIAIEEKVPPYIVFGDNTLKEMCKYYPITDEELLDISGVGKNKLEKYGDRFIMEIQKYKKNK